MVPSSKCFHSRKNPRQALHVVSVVALIHALKQYTCPYLSPSHHTPHIYTLRWGCYYSSCNTKTHRNRILRNIFDSLISDTPPDNFRLDLLGTRPHSRSRRINEPTAYNNTKQPISEICPINLCSSFHGSLENTEQRHALDFLRRRQR